MTVPERPLHLTNAAAILTLVLLRYVKLSKSCSVHDMRSFLRMVTRLPESVYILQYVWRRSASYDKTGIPEHASCCVGVTKICRWEGEGGGSHLLCCIFLA